MTEYNAPYIDIPNEVNCYATTGATCEQLRAIVGHDGVIDGAAALLTYEADGCVMDLHAPNLVVLPRSIVKLPLSSSWHCLLASLWSPVVLVPVYQVVPPPSMVGL
jgi:hypothetical protein